MNKKREYVHQTLIKYFDYYKYLSDPQRDVFLKRVAYFAGTTKFIPKAGFNLTEVHIVMISASFVQLTFGLRKSVLRHFNEFNIYPKHFMNFHTHHYHKGEINMSGSLSLSWEDYLEGQKDPNDGLNVGLHELAHAFSMEVTHSGMGYRNLVMKLQPADTG